MRTGGKNGVSAFVVITAGAICLFASGAAHAEATESRQPAALDHAGVYRLREISPQLTGTGVRIAVVSRSVTYSDGLPMNDYRPSSEHTCFGESTFTFHDRGDLPAGISAHETAIASILFGRDPNASFAGLGTFRYEGVTPDATGDFHEFRHFLTDTVFPLRRPDADVVTISLGSQFEDWWTRGIEAMSERYGVPVVAGIGNGISAHDSTLFPAAGSNVIGVGVVEEIRSSDLRTGLSRFWLPRPASSSCGPTDDNRAKPDIVAPGRCLAADVADASAFVITPSGSSYATPVVAGVIGLLWQAAKADPNLSLAAGEGAGCVMKAILMTSARKLPYWQKGAAGRGDDHLSPLDHSQGAGELDAVAAYELLKAGRQEVGNVGGSGWDFASLRLDGEDSRAYLLDPANMADGTITATLVWNRHYRQAYPFARDIARDADLSLELWAYDNNGARLADHSDSRVDNLEHVSFAAEPGKRYFLLVRLSDNGVSDILATENFAISWRTAPSPAKDAAWYDLNGDGVANVADAMTLIAGFAADGRREKAASPGDLSGDGNIDLLDLVLLSKAIGNP